MTMNSADWKLVVVALLLHFDEMEGTTHLYNLNDRASFAEQFGANRDEVRQLLDAYHAKRKR